jgi:putative colanic acid biosynthesis UDP-glucose lipid carrier transferase
MVTKNSFAQIIPEASALRNADYQEALEIVYKKEAAIFSFDLETPLEARANLIFKRFIDLSCSVFLLVFVFSWITPLLAILIKLDSKGPVFFFQKRNKRNGEAFTCIKFRTMIINDDADILPAFENDHRITRLGKKLRDYHLDELPQLLNVLWGDMSLIGPRPHMFTENLKYQEIIDFYADRHRVKPGITGLAQIKGYVGSTQDPEQMARRVRLDVFYIRHWSPALDTKIIFQTFFKMIGF